MDFAEMDRLFSYKHKTGNVRNKVDRGKAKAGAIATSRDSKGYLRVQVTKDGRQVSYLAHRVAWLLYYGIDPGANEIDHIDCQSKTNNKIENLRLISHGDNMKNQGRYKNNTSGIMGVGWHKGTGKWQVRISDRGEPQRLGYFDDFFEACCRRKSAERRLDYHPNHGK